MLGVLDVSPISVKGTTFRFQGIWVMFGYLREFHDG